MLCFQPFGFRLYHTNIIRTLSSTGCPEGVEEFVCLTAPCTVNTCTAHPDATCRDNYCGGCNAEFYDANGNQVNCDGRLLI